MKKILDFWAPWCSPCAVMKPIIEEIEQEQNVEIVKINIDDNREMAMAYGVRSIPTLLVMEGDKVAHRIMGQKSKEFILSYL